MMTSAVATATAPDTARAPRNDALVDVMAALLRALADVLDVRTIFPRVSQIAATVLPHDRLTLTFHDPGGEVVVQASSDDPAPARPRLRLVQRPRDNDDSVAIISDIRTEACSVIDPPDFKARVLSAGYRSALKVQLKAQDQSIGLQFWSKRPGAFDERHVPIARRIADHVALAVSHERLAEAAHHAGDLAHHGLAAVRARSLPDDRETPTGRDGAAGASAEWQDVMKAATQVASTDSTVLMLGESGTGKEVVARHIHRASARANGPFVAVNCAALPEHLLESELFGYERGAFTGAQHAKPGQIELAAGGVLFLDEVSEMSAPAQAKLLRVLQEREFRRLGATRSLKAQVRFIAATNRDLKTQMERGDFREDLFYRLHVFDISLPPLRERGADVLVLSDVFLRDIGRLFGRPPASLSREAKAALLRHHWPGNVRELRNALERATILSEGGVITPEHLFRDGERCVPRSDLDVPATTDLNALEGETIRRVLADCAGNKSRAALRLGISRTQLYVRLRKHRLS
jgi:DNA-binding NtrC family response regulator